MGRDHRHSPPLLVLMYSLVPPERLRGSALIKEAEQTLASWGLTGVSYKIRGNKVTFVHDGATRTVMVWDFISALNEIAVAAF